jgi:hypothetical protein
MTGAENMLDLRVRVQSLETGLFLTRDGAWVGAETKEELLKMRTIEGLKLCVRLGLRNVRFSAKDSQTGTEMCEYPFGGEPGAG